MDGWRDVVQRVIGLTDMPVGEAVVAVGKSAASDDCQPHSLLERSDLTYNQEKLLKVEAQLTVLKLTQVGGARSLRRSGECWLRNSAKWPRNFGIRGAL